MIVCFQRGGQIDKSALKALEQRDAELARIMQEQEKLKVRKRRPPLTSHRSQNEGPVTEHEGHTSRQMSAPEGLPVSHPVSHNQ